MKKTCLAGMAAALAAGMNAATGCPNIVLFMVDDMGWQDTSLPFHEERTPLNERYRTPNMERLAEMGMKFTSAYACAISSPSRCSLMTGMNQARHRVTNWTLNRDRMTDDALDDIEIPSWNYNGIQPSEGINNSAYCTPLPELLRRGGYNTIHVGKAHFGSIGTPSANPLAMGFDVNVAGTAAGGVASGGYLGQNRYGHNEDGVPISSFSTPHLEKYWNQDVFLTEALTREAIQAVDSLRDSGKPFYLYMAHYAVHIPFCPDSRYIDNYPDLDVTERQYAAMIEGMDKSLGDIMDYLERTGQMDNTVIIFMSDNGGLDFYSRGQMPPAVGSRHNYPLRSGKGSAYEGGVREPMIVYWNGVVRPGSVCDSYIIIEDFFPTILDMAQVADRRTVQPIDGVSFIPLLTGASDPSIGRALYWNTPNNWTNMIPLNQKLELGIGPSCAIRKGDYKLIYRYDNGTKQLYNLADDIGEQNDLSALCPEIVDDLSRQLGRYLREADAQRPSRKVAGVNAVNPCPWPDEVD